VADSLGVPSGLPFAMKYHAIAALLFAMLMSNSTLLVYVQVRSRKCPLSQLLQLQGGSAAKWFGLRRRTAWVQIAAVTQS